MNVLDQASGTNWQLYNGDSCAVTPGMPADSIDYTIFSPPFSNLYIYSDSIADMGNAADSEEFFKHFGFLIPELLRVTVPGRLCSIHCKDLPLYRGRDEVCGLDDFPGAIVRAMNEAGWTFHSRTTIWKCPVIERERTNNNGLLHKTVCRDSSQVRQGMADFLLTFRKPPSAGSNLSDKPIVREKGFTEFVGDPALNPMANTSHPSPYARTGITFSTVDGQRVEAPSIAIWRRYAEPVWWDIDQTDVLNYKVATTDRDEKHICPLQLRLIDRAVELWSNPGDVVFSPFAGIGSEGYMSVLRKRKFIGIELKPEYFALASKHLAKAEEEASQRGLFDDLKEPEEADSFKFA